MCVCVCNVHAYVCMCVQKLVAVEFDILCVF